MSSRMVADLTRGRKGMMVALLGEMMTTAMTGMLVTLTTKAMTSGDLLLTTITGVLLMTMPRALPKAGVINDLL